MIDSKIRTGKKLLVTYTNGKGVQITMKIREVKLEQLRAREGITIISVRDEVNDK